MRAEQTSQNVMAQLDTAKPGRQAKNERACRLFMHRHQVQQMEHEIGENFFFILLLTNQTLCSNPKAPPD